MKLFRQPLAVSLIAPLSVLSLAFSLARKFPARNIRGRMLSAQNWVTLNGPWQFEIDEQGDGESRGLISGHDLASTITVPFCPESKLSGIGHYGLHEAHVVSAHL
jgi:hypothetical protein